MKQPNILFLFPDQHRRDWMPYEERVFKPWQTEKPDLRLPNLEKIMSQGVTFLNAVTASPLCAPARACLASGTRYPRCETLGNGWDYPLEKPTFYQSLQDVGYEVLGVGKFDFRKLTCDWFETENPKKLGFTHSIDSEGKMDAVAHFTKYGEARGPYMKFLEEKGNNYAQIHNEDITDRKNKTHQTPLPDEVYCDNWIGQNAIDLISDSPKDKPWFIQVNFNGPHGPFDITEKMYETVKDRHYALGHKPREEENAEEVRKCYAAMIENIDRNIGLILDCIKERGELENTVIVYASDHGDMLGDHGRYAKCVPQRGSIDIPMIVSMPNSTRKGEYDNSLVELQDLSQTFVEMAGGNFSQGVDSLSLCDLLEGKKNTHREFTYTSLKQKIARPYDCIIAHGFKYIQYEDGASLFDLKNDPWEDEDIYTRAQNVEPELIEKLQNYLQSVEN